MNQQIEISVIVPYGYFSPDLSAALQSAASAYGSIEMILVTNRALKKGLDGMLPRNCRVIESEEQGRGYFCSAGAKVAKGSIVLFLHADTTLPSHWDRKVVNIMSDPSVAGGGFSTLFRSDHWFLRRIPALYNAFSKVIREFWGDRALFMRKKDLIAQLDNIDIPIMEDVEMSKIMRRNGKMVLLSDVVTTSDFHFSAKGYFQQILEVILFRSLYALGVQADRIYKWYYRMIE